MRRRPSRGTSCPRRWSSAPSSSAARRARPTTDGRVSRRSAETLRTTDQSAQQGNSVYGTSKQAAILDTKRLAGPAWAEIGVRVNTVSPGPVETPILADFEATMGKEVLDMCGPPGQARDRRRHRSCHRVRRFAGGTLDHRPGHSRRRRLPYLDDRWAPIQLV